MPAIDACRSWPSAIRSLSTSPGRKCRVSRRSITRHSRIELDQVPRRARRVDVAHELLEDRFEGSLRERAAKLLHRVVRDHVPVVQHEHARTGLLDRIELVRAIHHGLAGRRERLEEVAEDQRRRRVEPRHRLVEDEQRGIVEQGRRDQDFLPHALRVRRERGLRLCLEAEEFQQRGDPLAADARVQVVEIGDELRGTRCRSGTDTGAVLPARSRCAGGSPPGRPRCRRLERGPRRRSGSTSPVSMPTVVVLPDPFGPR